MTSWRAAVAGWIVCGCFALSACGNESTSPTTDDPLPGGNPGGDSPTSLVACATTNPDPAEVNVDEQVTLNASCSEGPSELVSYSWDLGDGRSRTGEVIHPRYTNPGEYQVRLEVADTAGNRDSTELDVVVGAPLQACVEWEQVPASDTELAPCGYRFDASCSTGDIVEYRWFFQGNPDWPGFDDQTLTTTDPEAGYTWREDIVCFAFRPFERIVRLTVVDESGEMSTVEEVISVTTP